MGKKNLLLVFLLMGMVVAGIGGCIQGFHGGNTSAHTGRGAGAPTGTSSGVPNTAASTSSKPLGGVSLEEIGKLGHVMTMNIKDLQLKGIKTWVDGAVWRSNLRWFNLRFADSPWFYSGGNLYVFEHNSDNFYAYVESNEEPGYPFYVIHVPINGVDFTYGGPSGTVAVVDTSG
ncbi:MAG: hypothetical protein GXO14_01000, partial [Thermococci archaeon]|nr:hypothetical protein [Thermococci archaeon]